MTTRRRSSCKELVQRVLDAAHDVKMRKSNNPIETLETRASQLEKFCAEQCGEKRCG